MPNSPVVTARKFGQWLQLQRGDRSREQVALKVRPLLEPVGLKVDQSLIQRIEQGRVPSWPLLAALCRVYRVDIRHAVLQLIETIEFPGSADLLCPAEGVPFASQSPHTQEGGTLHDASSARLIADHARAFADQIREFTDAFARTIETTAGDFTRQLEQTPAPPSDRTPLTDAPHRARPRRKTG